MKLFVGLGNPGSEYAGNRHNVGFMAVEEIASAHRFGPWKRKFQVSPQTARSAARRCCCSSLPPT